MKGRGAWYPYKVLVKGAELPAELVEHAKRDFSGLLFFHRDGDGAVRRKANLLAFDIGNQVEIDEMMVPLVPAFTAVGLGQFNPTIFNSIDGSDVHAIGPDDFHMLFYPGLSHFNLLYGQGQRAREPYVQFEEFPAPPSSVRSMARSPAMSPPGSNDKLR